MMLQLALPGCLGRMRTQEITQVNVITMRLAARHHNVQVVIGGIREWRERLPALDAQVSLVPPSRNGQPRDRRAHGRLVGDHHVHVDDRLGIQPGNRSAADVPTNVRARSR